METLSSLSESQRHNVQDMDVLIVVFRKLFASTEVPVISSKRTFDTKIKFGSIFSSNQWLVSINQLYAIAIGAVDKLAVRLLEPQRLCI